MSTEAQRVYFQGVRTVPYDLVRELVIAMAGVLILILILAATLSSPDEKPETIRSWAQAQPVDLVQTAVSELDGSSFSAGYGPPYNHGSGALQSLGFFSPQQWFGVRDPVNSAYDFVIHPLQLASATDPALAKAVTTWEAAASSRQDLWLKNYGDALKQAQVAPSGLEVAPGSYGPLPTMMDSLLLIARSGGLDGLLLSTGDFYATDYTQPLMFMGDGGYLASLAQAQHLQGNQWGMMNETGSYPGQTWLWLYTLWYQVPLFNQSRNADLLVVITMGILSLALVLVPFIPGIRDLPRVIGVHKLIWRQARR